MPCLHDTVYHQHRWSRIMMMMATVTAAAAATTTTTAIIEVLVIVSLVVFIVPKQYIKVAQLLVRSS